MDSPSKTALWQRREGEKIRCLLCPHGCLLGPGETGRCRVRKYDLGEGLVSLNYGLISSLALDPIEKKPLYHWNPASSILSLGTVGCSMNCPFCQNWSIAGWGTDVRLTPMEPEDIPAMASRFGACSVAFTYNEPFVWYEFVLDASRSLKKVGLSAVVVSNGQINPGPLEDLAPYIAAANIDLKAFTPEAYKFLGGSLGAAQNSIKTLTATGVHVEVTFLLVPGINDDREAFEAMVKWLASLCPVPVLHISRYFPAREWSATATPPALLDEYVALAVEYLPRVYPGNTGEGSDTKCLCCGAVLVSRKNCPVSLPGLDARGLCAACGTPADIVITEGESCAE